MSSKQKTCCHPWKAKYTLKKTIKNKLRVDILQIFLNFHKIKGPLGNWSFSLSGKNNKRKPMIRKWGKEKKCKRNISSKIGKQSYKTLKYKLSYPSNKKILFNTTKDLNFAQTLEVSHVTRGVTHTLRI